MESGKWITIEALRTRLDAERADAVRAQARARAGEALQGPEAVAAALDVLRRAGITIPTEAVPPAMLSKDAARAELRARVDADEAAHPEDKGTPPAQRPDLSEVLESPGRIVPADTYDDEGQEQQ
jgi:hypothetical protein